MFLENMLEIIDQKSMWAMKPLREHRAFIYFLAVRHGGDLAFKEFTLAESI